MKFISNTMLFGLAVVMLTSCGKPATTPPGLTVRDGQFYKDGQPLQVVGINYFNAFLRKLGPEGGEPNLEDDSYREAGTVEYLHRWEELVGGLCRCGFVIEDLTEPYRGDPQAPVGSWRHRGLFVAPYLRMKARRLPREAGTNSGPQLWTPP